MAALTPHEAMVAWGVAVCTRSEARESWKAAERAYAATNVDTRDAAWDRLVAAIDVYHAHDARRTCAPVRRAVCDAYTQAGFPQAVRVLKRIAPGALGWSPDLEDVLAALLADPART